MEDTEPWGVQLGVQQYQVVSNSFWWESRQSVKSQMTH